MPGQPTGHACSRLRGPAESCLATLARCGDGSESRRSQGDGPRAIIGVCQQLPFIRTRRHRDHGRMTQRHLIMHTPIRVGIQVQPTVASGTDADCTGIQHLAQGIRKAVIGNTILIRLAIIEGTQHHRNVETRLAQHHNRLKCRSHGCQFVLEISCAEHCQTRRTFGNGSQFPGHQTRHMSSMSCLILRFGIALHKIPTHPVAANTASDALWQMATDRIDGKEAITKVRMIIGNAAVDDDNQRN